MGLAERVSAGDQRNGLLVIHRHALEGLADIARRGDRVRLAVRPFRIDIDQAHLHGAERILKFTVAGIAFVGQPFAFGAPIDVFFRLPDVGAAAAETEGLEAHRIQGDIAGENQKIGPGDFAAVFLLDRPEQPARLVQIDIVRPAIQRRKALLPGPGAAAAVADAIGAGAMPGHADEERPVMAEIGRPPFLRIGHQGVQVLDDRVEVEALELFGVIEGLPHRIGERGMLVENPEIELFRPPVAIDLGEDLHVLHRALASFISVHGFLRSGCID